MFANVILLSRNNNPAQYAELTKLLSINNIDISIEGGGREP